MRRFQEEQAPAVNNAKYLALLLIFFGILLGTVYLCTEEIVVRKILLKLALPTGFCWIALLSVSYFLIVNNHRWLGFLCISLSLVFSIAGNEIVASLLARSLEEPYLDFRIEDAKEYDVVVLLGGGTHFAANEQSQLGPSGDRVMVALQMHQMQKTGKIICTGSPILSLNQNLHPSPGEQSREILIRSGVPAADIELVEGRNTGEEIRNLAKRFREGDLKVGIISSAWHLPRVTRLADAEKLRFEPIPSDFISSEIEVTAVSMIPQGGPMAVNTKLIKEMIAKAVGQ